MEKLSTMQAVKRYFGDNADAKRHFPTFEVSNKELLDFTKGTPIEERRAFGQAVCAVLGAEWTETK